MGKRQVPKCRKGQAPLHPFPTSTAVALTALHTRHPQTDLQQTTHAADHMIVLCADGFVSSTEQ